MKRPDIETCAACKLGPPDWEYTCHNCLRDFTMPAARGPTEEKGRTCPACGSRNIERLNIAPSEACAPGG
jgi:rRNA maturation endonuclease Nob1